MRSIIILSFIAVLCACNNQSSTKEPGSDNANAPESTAADKTKDVSVDMIENPATAGNPNAQSAKYPVMSFKSTFFDFGDIVEPQKVETTFEFRNTGNADLLISECKAACGCTVPDWPRHPIKPGQSGEIKVEFDSNGKSGVNNKIVTVISNTREGTMELKFRANVQAKKAE